MFIELHFLQNFAPANLNRDDTGNPKDAEFGGVRRLRISSQALKRAMRYDPVFASTTALEPATRTKHMAERMLAPALVARGHSDEEALAVAAAMAKEYGSGLEGGEARANETKVLVYLSKREIDQVADQLHARWAEAVAGASAPADETEGVDKPKKTSRGKKAANKPAVYEEVVKFMKRETKGRTSAPDIALFGRMLAEHPELNIDAACQVAHALSTHAIRGIDTDYYTAVDDLRRDDTAGSAMIGTTAFGSACFYRYLRLDVDQLRANLSGDQALTRRTVEAFIRAAEAALPTGKQNSFAAHSRPSFLMAVGRAPRSPGWSLVNAFVEPVGTGGNLIGKSVQRLERTWQGLIDFYGSDSVKSLAVAIQPDSGLSPDALGPAFQSARQTTFQGWVSATMDSLD